MLGGPYVQPLLEAGLVLLRLVEEQADVDWLEWEGTPGGVFRCAKAVDDEGVLTLSEGLGETRLPYGRDILPDLRLRALDRELAKSCPSRYGPAAAFAAASASPLSAPATAVLAAASAPPAPAQAAAASCLIPPMWGGVARSYTARAGARNTRARRAYPIMGNSSYPRIGGRSGPPVVGPLPLFTWEGSAQLGAPRPLAPAVWAGLGRSLGDVPPIMNNGVDHSLIMALSRAYVRLRNEVASVVSRPMGDQEAGRLCTLVTVDSLRHILAEEYNTAVVETTTVMSGWSLRHMGAAVPTVGPISPATHQRPPSPAPPHNGAGSSVAAAPHYGGRSGSYPAPSYGAGSGIPAMHPHGATTGSSANPPCPSGSEYYAPEGGFSQGDSPGVAPRSWGY